MRFLISVVLILFVLSVASCDNKPPAKEKFYRGNVVVVKLDKRRGTVVDKKFQFYGNGNAKEVWKYEVRFPNNAPGATSAYVTTDLYEWELEAGPVEGQ